MFPLKNFARKGLSQGKKMIIHIPGKTCGAFIKISFYIRCALGQKPNVNIYFC